MDISVKRSTASANEANLLPTPTLDYRSERVQAVGRGLRGTAETDHGYLQAGHRFLCGEVAPVYTVDELQPTSVTLAKRRGSCSQRFACLESLARATGIPTRVRGLWIAGEFWAPRFKLTRMFVPRRVLLAWPQFYVEGGWLGVERLFGTLESLARQDPRAFANDGESLFDAIGHAAVDFRGETAGCVDGRCDLSRFAAGDAGVFASRDDLFAAFPLFQRTLRGRAFEIIYGGRASV